MTKAAATIAAIISILIPAAYADVVSISASFGAIRGAGSFNTDGTCAVCQPSGSLSNFSFTLDGDAFALDRMTYFRATNSITASFTAIGEPSSRLVFTPSGNVQFQSKEDGHTVVLHGDYTIAGAAPTGAGPSRDNPTTPAIGSAAAPADLPASLVNAAAAAITAIPEPRASLFLGTVVIALAAARFFRRHSEGRPLLPR